MINLKGISVYKDKIVNLYILLCGLFLFFANITSELRPIDHMAIGYGMMLVFIVFNNPLNIRRIPISINRGIDITFICLGLYSLFYVMIHHEELIWRLGNPTDVDLIVGFIGSLVAIELSRRVKLVPMTIISLIFIAYALFGEVIPGYLGNSGFSLSRIIRFVWLSTEGVFGSLTMVTFNLLYIFILWGGLLTISGASDFFMRLASLATKKLKSGPAMLAVVSSGLLGSVVGSAVANVATTGNISIPMMKKRGFSSDFAGAVEAAASTGGQILPPVMGITAFIMADITGIAYIDIATAALFPALLFFLSVGLYVHFHSTKLYNEGKLLTNETEIELEGETFATAIKDKNFLKGFLYFIPIVLLVYLLAKGYSTMYTGIVVSALTLVVTFFFKKPTEILNSIPELFKSTLQTFAGMVGIAGCIGIIVGMVTMTGLNFKLSEFITYFGSGSLFLTLVFTMLVCIVLGMGMPTPAAYILVSLAVAPALVELGIPMLAAHFFVFYFASLSAITPPVAVAVIAACAISGGKIFKTGFYTIQISLIAFIVPFLFIYTPEYLGLSGFSGIYTTINGILIVLLLTLSLEGYAFDQIKLIPRLIFLILAGLFILPEFWTSLYIIKGLTALLVLCFLLWTLWFRKKETKVLKTC